MYDIEVKLASKNGWFTPAEARSYYGKYARDGVTCHWWGDGTGASNHDNIVNYLNSNSAKGISSVNYVVSDNKITMCVNPDDVAWTSQGGNATTVSIEHQPTLGDEGYKKSGWLVHQLELRYGKELRLYPHNYWNQTQCPGTISIDRIAQEANKWARGEYSGSPAPTPTPTPTPQPEIVGVDFATITPATYVANKQPTNLYQVNKGSWGSIGVVKTFNKGDRIDIFGVVKNPSLNGAEWYVTKYSFDNKLPNGFSKADLDLYVAPAPTPAPVVEPVYTDMENKELYTLTNAKLVDMKTLAVVKTFPFDTPVEVSAKATYNNMEFYVSEYAFTKKTGQGFLVGDLTEKQTTPTPPGTPEPTPVEPDKPEWVKNLQDQDDTKYWVKKEQKLIDITTGQPAVVNGLETTFEKDDEFVSSARTVVKGVEYRITDYSFKKGIFNGLPIDSLTLTAPGVPDIDPTPTPVDPVVSANVVVAFLTSIVTLIQAFIKNITTK